MSKHEGKRPERTVQAEPRTVHLDRAPGRSPKLDADAAVDSALATAGSGMAADGGATFHDDSTSHAAADALGARAFTAGSDVYFGAGQYAPGTAGGDTLIRHELTHVEQGRGVEAPQPGNFSVSSPSDSAEVAARDGAAGGSASAATIYRDLLPGGGAPATTGTGPAAGGPPAPAPAPAGASPPPGGPAPAPTSPYDEWKAAITGYKSADAIAKWPAVPAADKAKVKGEGRDFHTTTIYVMQKDSVQVLKEAGLAIADYSYNIFAQDGFADFLGPLRAHGLLNGFLDAEPLKTHVSAKHAAKLATWVGAAPNATEAKRIFEKAYPTLHDTAPGPVSFNGVVAMWPLARIKRLFEVLSQYLSAAHASTITGGFVYVTAPGFGWWSPDQKRVFLPASHDNATHDMTGGGAQGHKATDTTDGKGNVTNPTGRSVNADFTSPDGTKKTGAAAGIGHFTGTILHEVGHGVGARLDGGRGNSYAEDSASWPGFNVKMDFDTWANALWVSGATGTGTEPTVHKNARLDESHAKDFLKTEISSGKGKYSPGWTSNPPRADMAAYVKWRYSSVPLAKWWDYLVERGLDKGSSYAWDEDSARVRDGWVYAYLTRGGCKWSKFKADAWNKKVSWYSLSSPKEWFAEQYTHFYRTEKSGSGIDAATLALLQDLDKKQFVPDKDGEGGSTISAGGAEAGTGQGIGSAPAGARAGGAGPAPGAKDPPTRPLFFPW